MSNVLWGALAGPFTQVAPDLWGYTGKWDANAGWMLFCSTACFFHRRFCGILSLKGGSQSPEVGFLGCCCARQHRVGASVLLHLLGQGSRGPADFLLPPLVYSTHTHTFPQSLFVLFSLFFHLFLSFRIFFLFSLPPSPLLSPPFSLSFALLFLFPPPFSHLPPFSVLSSSFPPLSPLIFKNTCPIYLFPAKHTPREY